MSYFSSLCPLPKMSTSEENLYDAVCMYLLEGKYSDKETKNSKKVIRRKAKQFIIKEALLCKLSSEGATCGYISDCVLPGHMLAIDTNSCITTENKQPYVNTVL